MAQKIQIVDRNGDKGLDSVVAVREGGSGILLANQIKQIDGESYITSMYNAAVANNANIDIRIVTAAARKVLFNVEAQSNRVRMRIYENPSIAGGALLAAVPPDFGANLDVNFAWSAPVVTANGTLHFDGLVNAVADYIFTFQPSSDGFSYLVRFTNVSGVANTFSINMETFV